MRVFPDIAERNSAGKQGVGSVYFIDALRGNFYYIVVS
jgi:hypothetical protein